jgi:hypothetical protein
VSPSKLELTASPARRRAKATQRIQRSLRNDESVIGDRSDIVLTGFPLRFQPGERRQLSVGMQFVKLIRDYHFHIVEGHIW